MDKERIGAILAAHLRDKGLPALLATEADSLPTKEFGAGACMNCQGVCILAHEGLKVIRFDVLHPADDRHRCPVSSPAGFEVERDFDPRVVAEKIVELASRANALYAELGVGYDHPSPVEKPLILTEDMFESK